MAGNSIPPMAPAIPVFDIAPASTPSV